ncbi:MAG: ferredoxin [Thermodesulfobacteriota bacterium]
MTNQRDEKYFGISVDSYRCNGCGGCVELCPEHFVMDDGGDTAKEIRSRAKASRELEEAAAFCPRKCITIVHED